MSDRTKIPESSDWSAPDEQQLWFDQFKSQPTQTTTTTEGIKFNRFQDFLQVTLYTHFAKLVGEHQSNEQNMELDTKFSYQQELQLFSAFDINNDHLIDRSEFAHLCQNWLEVTYRRAWALVVVDVQNDFIDGSLALINGPARQDGAEVVPVINRLIESGQFDSIVYTQDWHPRDHIGFHDNLHLRKYTLKPRNTPETTTGETTTINNNKCPFKLKKLTHTAKLFDSVLFDEGRVEQKLWPVHCVQNSWGAELHPKLKVVPNAIRVYKGTLSHLDAYSAFWDNMRQNETGLRQELSSRKINDVFFCGVALDYCVASSALDSVKAGFMTLVIEDACRGLDLQEIDRRKRELSENGVLIISSDSLIGSGLVKGKTTKVDNAVKTMLLAKHICLRRAFNSSCGNGGSNNKQ